MRIYLRTFLAFLDLVLLIGSCDSDYSPTDFGNGAAVGIDI
jgi:hypothetical protein